MRRTRQHDGAGKPIRGDDRRTATDGTWVYGYRDVLILLASSRGDGNTAVIVDRLAAAMSPPAPEIIDLSALKLQPYSYSEKPIDDGFMQVIGQMRLHPQIVFATPVYWYAMSGQMKIFFDRLSDLLEDAPGKRVARELAGRIVSLIATGTEAELPQVSPNHSAAPRPISE